MMGMHGEAWVNTAIQEADLLIALGMRFDDRVTGNLKTYAPRTRKKIHVEIDPAEINKNVPVDVGIDRRRPRRRSWRSCLGCKQRDHGAWLARIDDAEGRLRRAATSSNMPDDGHLLRGARDPRPLAADRRQGDRGDGRGPAPDVGSAVLQHDGIARARSSPPAGSGTMGFALPAAMGVAVRAPGRRGLGGRAATAASR